MKRAKRRGRAGKIEKYHYLCVLDPPGESGEEFQWIQFICKRVERDVKLDSRRTESMKKPLFLQPFTQTKSCCLSAGREEPACGGTGAPAQKTNTRHEMNAYVQPPQLVLTWQRTVVVTVVTGYSPDIRGTPGRLLLKYSLKRKSSWLGGGIRPFHGSPSHTSMK